MVPGRADNDRRAWPACTRRVVVQAASASLGETASCIYLLFAIRYASGSQQRTHNAVKRSKTKKKKQKKNENINNVNTQ